MNCRFRIIGYLSINGPLKKLPGLTYFKDEETKTPQKGNDVPEVTKKVGGWPTRNTQASGPSPESFYVRLRLRARLPYNVKSNLR